MRTRIKRASTYLVFAEDNGQYRATRSFRTRSERDNHIRVNGGLTFKDIPQA